MHHYFFWEFGYIFYHMLGRDGIRLICCIFIFMDFTVYFLGVLTSQLVGTRTLFHIFMLFDTMSIPWSWRCLGDMRCMWSCIVGGHICWDSWRWSYIYFVIVFVGYWDIYVTLEYWITCWHLCQYGCDAGCSSNRQVMPNFL